MRQVSYYNPYPTHQHCKYVTVRRRLQLPFTCSIILGLSPILRVRPHRSPEKRTLSPPARHICIQFFSAPMVERYPTHESTCSPRSHFIFLFRPPFYTPNHQSICTPFPTRNIPNYYSSTYLLPFPPDACPLIAFCTQTSRDEIYRITTAFTICYQIAVSL